MLNPVLIQTGTATGPGGPVAISADVSHTVTGGQSNQRVQINTGWTYTTTAWGVTRPSLCGSATSDVTGLVWPTGATLVLVAPEAIALCASGAASFLGTT